MDAKPQRPLRSTRIHDENAIMISAAAGKAVHQRHKSSPALSNFINVAAVKALAPKRSAFADVSNARSNQPTKDDAAINGKAAIVKSKMSQGVESNGKDQPLARKPQRAATLKSSIPPQSQPLVSSTSAHQLSGIPIKSLPSEPSQRNLAVNQKKPSTSKENSEPSIEELLAEHDTASATSLLDEALEKALNGAAIDGELAGVRFPVHVLPSQSSMTNQVPNYLSPVSAFPDTHEQAQAALQAVLLQEQQQAVPHIPTNNTKSIPLRSQGYYEPEYEATSYEGDYTTHKSIGMVSDTTGGTTLVLAPKYTAKIRQEIAAAKDFVDATRTLEDIEDDHWDTSMVTEYGDEIFEYYRTLEERMRPNPHYMDHQTECQWSMRAVLLDWLVQVHARFTLLPETLFLSVNYIDRFLSTKVVSLAKLQLVGATALFLAAKYEEVNCPSISEIVYMVDNGYSMDEILKAERFMLSMLNFELGWPGPMSFLRRVSKADDYDLETRTLAKYFLEVTIMDERFLACPPSSTAAAAHCLARLMLRKGDWTQAHVYYSNYTYAQLRPLLSVIVECCENPVQHHSAVFNKYLDKRYKKSASYVQQEMQNGFALPRMQTRNSSFGMLDLSLSQGWRGMN